MRPQIDATVEELDVDPGVGMTRLAPTRSATGPMLGARARADADRSEPGTSA